MAIVLTIANNKGGCGKTTTAANVSAGLARAGFDVLAIDADGQANLTACLGVKVTAEVGTTYDALKTQNAPYIEPVPVLTTSTGGRLSLLPSVADLSAVEAGLVSKPDRLTRFPDMIKRYNDKYDFIIIDTPPAVGILTISALRSATGVIITLQPQILALQGLVSMREIIRTLNENGAGIGKTTVLFTLYDKRKRLHRMTIEQVEAAGVETYTTKIRDTVTLSEAPAAGLDIFRYAPMSKGAEDYSALCAEIQQQYL